jgi:two-component system, cell cycle sensor histidine kinase and response regulator CckA
VSLAGELRIASEVADRRAGCVLIVDDEPALRRFAARVLSEEGYSILEAADGLEAIQQIDANRSAIDVVVSDIVMPRVTGTELLQQLARRHPTLPVVLMSGYAAAVLLERGIAAPCAVLAKPFTPEQLVDEVRRCLPARS